jgi:hypothetical protein
MRSVTFRLTEEQISELEELAPLVQQLPAYKSVTVNKTMILRMALDIDAAELRRQVEAVSISKKKRRQALRR